MRYAIIENGVVVNTAEADPVFAQEQGWVATEEADKGWAYADGVFAEPEAEAPIAALAPTKEGLLAQLNTIAAQIQAME